MYKTEALADNLREIAPYIELEAHTERITEDNAIKLLKGAEIICEAFDDAESKARLANTVLTEMRDKYLVAASGMAGMGTVNSIKTRKITDRFYLSGDETSDVSNGIGLVATRVALCAAHQAHTVLRILAKQFDV
jgi:sulfur carrier protein ThiS adenylyltransferase